MAELNTKISTKRQQRVFDAQLDLQEKKHEHSSGTYLQFFLSFWYSSRLWQMQVNNRLAPITSSLGHRQWCSKISTSSIMLYDQSIFDDDMTNTDSPSASAEGRAEHPKIQPNGQHTLHGLLRMEGHFFPCKSRWTPKTQGWVFGLRQMQVTN